LPSASGEYTQIQDFVRQDRGVGGCVGLGDAQQNQRSADSPTTAPSTTTLAWVTLFAAHALNTRINTWGTLDTSLDGNALGLGAQSYCSRRSDENPKSKHKREPGGTSASGRETKTRLGLRTTATSFKLKDEYGNVWLGSAETVADNSIVYRFQMAQDKH
jgi:hypothetical protein